jgi:hypothetical protein
LLLAETGPQFWFVSCSDWSFRVVEPSKLRWFPLAVSRFLCGIFAGCGINYLHSFLNGTVFERNMMLVDDAGDHGEDRTWRRDAPTPPLCACRSAADRVFHSRLIWCQS